MSEAHILVENREIVTGQAKYRLRSMIVFTVIVVAIAVVLLEWAMRQTGVLARDGNVLVNLALALVLALPLFAVMSAIISCFAGAVLALFDRVFSFQRLYLLTQSALASSLLFTVMGMSVTMLTAVPAQLVLLLVFALNLAITIGYGVLLRRFVGAGGAGPALVATLCALYSLLVTAWGIGNA